MTIIGAKGHANELLTVLTENCLLRELYFFDNITNFSNPDVNFFDFPIIKDFDSLKKHFESDKNFCIGIGVPQRRFELTKYCISLGGKPISLISKSALIGNKAKLGKGVNLMPFTSVFNDSKIGDGVLVNSYASIHHDTEVGDYSELSPGCRILGYAKIGKLCSIGSNAVILPHIKITDNVIVGAGAVVSKNIDEPGVYVGVPAKIVSYYNVS